MADPRRRIDRYVVLDEVGRGGMGVVYRAFDPRLDRAVAIKVMPSQSGVAANDVERFAREGRAAARLNHEGIVGVLDRGMTERGDPFIVMDYVPGETLDKRLAARLPVARVLPIVRDVARALDYAHGQGIVHRDVKPTNIIITPEGQALLTDFGLATDAEDALDLTMPGETVGTPHYMSPEQARGARDEVGPSSDVYSLGVILYEAACGRRPFHAEAMLDLMKQIAQLEPPPLAADVPPALEALIMSCLRKQQSARPASAGALAAELDAIIAETGGAASSGAIAPGRASGRIARRSSGRIPRGTTARHTRAERAAGARSAGSRLALPIAVFAGALALGAVVMLGLRVVASSDGERTTGPDAGAPAEPPGVLLATPADGELIKQPSIAVRGQVSGDVEELTAQAGGARARIIPIDAGSDHFEGRLPVDDAEGALAVVVRARGPDGRETLVSVRVVVDLTPPALLVHEPADGAVAAGGTVTVRGTVTDAATTPHVRVDGREVPVEPDGTFVAEVSLAGESEHEVLIEAFDGADRTAEPVRRRVVVGAAGPALEVSAPAEGHRQAERSVRVAGRVETAQLATLRVHHQGHHHDVPAAADGTFGADIPVNQGADVLSIIAIDRSGAETQVRRRIFRDATPPSIDLVPEIPVESWGEEREVVTEGRLGEDGCRVTVNGAPVEVTGQTFAVRLALRPGINPLVIVATDPLGNQTRIDRGVVHHARQPEGDLVPPGTWWRPAPEQVAYARESGQPLWFEEPVLGLRFVLIPPGTFTVGSPATDRWRRPDETERQVTLTRGFYLAATEVSNAQFRRFRPTHTSGSAVQGVTSDDDAQPVVMVTKEDAIAFCAWLEQRSGSEGIYRLPTEAEWERGGRAGTSTTWFWGESVLTGYLYANGRPSFFAEDPHAASAPVGTRQPNPWGLFDTSGNACEYVSDIYDIPPAEAQTDPTGPAAGDNVLARGGGFMATEQNLRSAARFGVPAGFKNGIFGFRVLATRAPR